MAYISLFQKKRDQSLSKLSFSFNVPGPIIACTPIYCKAESVFVFHFRNPSSRRKRQIMRSPRFISLFHLKFVYKIRERRRFAFNQRALNKEQLRQNIYIYIYIYINNIYIYIYIYISTIYIYISTIYIYIYQQVFTLSY